MKKFSEDVLHGDGPVASEDLVFAAYRSNTCPDEMMEKAYRAGRLSQEEWKSWLASKEFCGRYQ